MKVYIDIRKTRYPRAFSYFEARDKCLSFTVNNFSNWKIVSSSESKQIFNQRYSLKLNDSDWTWWTSTSKNSTNNYIYSFPPLGGREGLIGYGEKDETSPSIYYDDGPSYSRRQYKGYKYIETCICFATYTVR